MSLHFPLSKLTTLIGFLLLFSAESSAIARQLIFPIPQIMQITTDDFTLDETVSIVIPHDASEKDALLARFLVRELSDKYGLAIRIESGTRIPENKKVVIMGAITNALVKEHLHDAGLEMNENNPGAEGYVLQVTNSRIVIAGWDDAGAFYGLQSLRQLINAGNGTHVQGVSIRDWPRLSLRGIRLYVPGPDNFAFFKRFVRDFMALYKFNVVILEMNCMRLDRHPEVNVGWVEFAEDLQYSRRNRPVGKRGEEKTSSHYDAGDGHIIEKEEVRRIVEFANENFIRVIPELPSLTHCYYLLARHPELAEYPGDNWPDTYCPSNPASYNLLFDVYDEYIEVMRPEMVHIGHDEWRVPMDVCPLCKGKDYSELYVQDVNKIYNYLTEKGIKVAMWGDHLLETVRNAGPREAISSTGVKYQKPGALRPALVKDYIPRDILVFNWFWGDPQNEKELQQFGFKQFYGNFKPNISNWDERMKNIDLVGGAPSSWAATNEFNFGKDLLFDFLGCANLLWSTHTLEQSDLADFVKESVAAVRSRLSAVPFPSEDGGDIGFIDITPHFNFASSSKAFGIDLRWLKHGEVNNGARAFHLPNPSASSGGNMIAVGSSGAGENPLPNAVKGIVIGKDVSSLLFLQACALPAGNQKAYYNMPDFFDTADLLGWYEIVYEDGFRINVPIQYGVNILEWNNGGENSLDKREGQTGSPQNIYCYQADPIGCSNDEKDNPITFYAFEWANPRLGKVIKEVNLCGTINYRATEAAGNPKTKPMQSNAILLAGISEIRKRETK